MAVEITSTLKKSAGDAQAHRAQLVFVYLPMFEGPQTIDHLDFSNNSVPSSTMAILRREMNCLRIGRI